MIITIDGPSGTGKTTIAKAVADRLNITYFDTGAMYRAITWLVLRENIDLTDELQLKGVLADFSYSSKEGKHICCGVDVTKEIRSQEVTAKVSEVSALKAVRHVVWEMQREKGEKTSAVFEGRDMGSVVFPHATLKIFLTASPRVRAERRLKELQEKAPEEAEKFTLETMERELERRDTFDSSRAIAPLIKPKGAIEIDTSEKSIEQITDEILELQKKAMKKFLPPWRKAKNMRFFYRFWLAVAWYFMRLFYRHKVYGLEHFYQGPGIIAPNHTSFWDPPIASTSWPEEIHFLARQSLFDHPLFGKFIAALNAHPVQGGAGDIGVFKLILKLLSEGKKIILFPEGERTSGEIGEIKPGIGMLLSKSQTAIIPTYIHGTHAIWPRGQKLPKLSGRTACVYGSPLFWEDFAHLDKKQVQQAIADELKKSLERLKNWYNTGAHGTPP